MGGNVVDSRRRNHQHQRMELVTCNQCGREGPESRMWAMHSCGQTCGWECGGGTANERECQRLAHARGVKTREAARAADDAAFEAAFGLPRDDLVPTTPYRDYCDRYLHEESGRRFKRCKRTGQWTELA